MPATKAARQSKISATVRNGRPQIKPAKKAAAAPAKQSKQPAKQSREQVVEQHKSRNAQGVEIQAAMTKQLLTVAQLAERTGYSENRVLEHCNYEISKGRSKMNTKKQVVVLSQPMRRAAS